MKIPESLGREIKDYITTLLNREVIVLDKDSKCISSPDQSQVNQKIEWVDESRHRDYSDVSVNSKKMLLIPLMEKTDDKMFLLMEMESGDNYDQLVPLVKSFSELLIDQYIENNQPKLDTVDHFVIKLLNNASTNDLPYYNSEAKALGYDTSIKRIAIVLHLKGFWENCLLDFDQASFERDQVIQNWKRNIEVAINSFFTKNNDLISAYVGSDRFVVFKAVDNATEKDVILHLKKSYKAIFEPIKSHRISGLTVGFGSSHEGIEGLISAYRESDLTLELGEKIWGENRSYYFEDLGILSIIAQGDRERKVDFATKLLSRLNNEDLHKTLECFFENNLNLTETALRMGIHRNTVIYRLNQITKSLNADPRVFEQAMSIKIALMIKGLFGAGQHLAK